MLIHTTARFEGKDLNFHNDFTISLPENHINEMSGKIASLAIHNFKKKCAEHFKVKFDTLTFFEVYFHNSQNEEITIFKKEKQC